MYILRFTFENHRSFRDEQDLTLVQPRLRTSRPLDGTWADYTNRVAAIYGANASGKSALLDAIGYTQAVIKNSATGWAGRKRLPLTPFRLDEVSRDKASTFALEFVLDEVRYEYGFALKPSAVQEEWLYYYPSGRKKILFERWDALNNLKFGRDLKGGEVALEKATGPRELVLSKGAASNNVQLKSLWDAITSRITVADFGETSRTQRLKSVIREVADGTLALEDLQTMLHVADVGIAGAEVAEEEADPRVRRILRKIFDAIDDVESGSEEARADADKTRLIGPDNDQLEELIQAMARNLMFMHTGADEKTYQMPSDLQSTGTLTWLSLAAPALKCIRTGGVFVVDELDASLHPQLAQVMIQMFKDGLINRNHAQLIFTTHDTYFMSSTADVTLSPDEVWLVEKARDGASDLFSLSEFPTRSGQNLSRRYLQGRYGAVPSVAPAFLVGLIPTNEDRAEDGDGRASRGEMKAHVESV